jgi:hypothetical protein
VILDVRRVNDKAFWIQDDFGLAFDVKIVEEALILQHLLVCIDNLSLQFCSSGLFILYPYTSSSCVDSRSGTCDHLDPPPMFQIQDGGAPQRYTGTHLLAYTSDLLRLSLAGILVDTTPRLHKRQPSASANIFVDHVRPSRRYDGSQVQPHPALRDEHLRS